jgi:cytochrome c5
VAEAATVARIRPVGDAYAGSTGAAAQAAAKAAAAAAAAGQVAYEGTLDGAVIYNNLCSACHGSGAGGAPKLEKAAWAARIAQGMDVVNQHAIEGYTGQAGMMPAKGGNPSLSDEQVVATVQWMVDNLK